MKKITAALDGLKYSKTTADYAIELAKQTNAHLVGIFMDDETYTSYKIYDLIVKQGVSEERLKKFEQKDASLRNIAAKDFEEACQKAKIAYSIHHDKNFAIRELTHESIYTDLMIIDVKETLSHHSEKVPTHFIRNFLSDAQCPVLLVSQKYKPIEKIILLYDGEPSSVHAIKTFSYLLPQLKELDTEVIAVNPTSTTLHLPDNKLMKEFMKRHYPKTKYTVLKGNAENAIISRLKEQQKNCLVVLGAYRRNAVSRWFRESMADVLMKETKFPLFIAHNK